MQQILEKKEDDGEPGELAGEGVPTGELARPCAACRRRPGAPTAAHTGLTAGLARRHPRAPAAALVAATGAPPE